MACDVRHLQDAGGLVAGLTQFGFHALVGGDEPDLALSVAAAFGDFGHVVQRLGDEHKISS